VSVGIAGGSGSGKTTLIKQFVEQSHWNVTELPQDRYYRDLSHLPPEERTQVNFDRPDALEIDRFLHHLEELIQGKIVEAPLYDFDTHTQAGTQLIQPGDLIVVEGTLTLAIEEIRQQLDLTVYIDTPADIRLIRKILRDTATRGRTLEASIGQYLDTVRPMFDRFVAPSKMYANLIVDGTKPIPALVEELTQALKPLLGNMKKSQG